MKEKEEILLNEIVNYYKRNGVMPTRRFLQKTLNYKSVNSITKYFKSLEEQNYLTRNSDGKIILNKYVIDNTNLKTINIINTTNETCTLIIDRNKKYVAYKIHNNYFNNIGILRNDILIIELNKTLKDDDIALFIINKQYRIMKYRYQDGFYILKDKEEILLNRVKIIGKVIMIERKLWENLKVLIIKHIIRSWTYNNC